MEIPWRTNRPSPQVYVKLYKTKLKCLREEQVIDNDILQELEQMEKEYDIEGVLNYRSTAETELQEFLLNSNSSLEVSGASHNDERSSSRARGWLNWLSRGMLGAGGTDDSSQFSGVVSDEVIKDIYEATEFQPAPLPDGISAADDIIFFSEIKFHIHQVSATLWNILLEAFDLILSSAQNLVVPIKSNSRRKLQESPTAHNGCEFC